MLRYPPKPHSSPNSPLLADQLASNTCPFETPRFASHTRRSAYRPGKPHVFLSTKQPLHPLIHGPGRHSASSQYGVGFDWFHKINASPPLHIVANAPWHPAFPPHLLLSQTSTRTIDLSCPLREAPMLHFGNNVADNCGSPLDWASKPYHSVPL